MSYLKGLAMAVVMAFASPVQAATTVNVDLMFVVDRSGSMRQEFQTLGARIGEVLNGLAGATNPTNGVSIGSVQAGLVSYLGTPQLEQSVTGNVTALQNAFNNVNVTGSIERGLTAVNSVLPGGSLFNAAGWRSDTVKSIVLITDEFGNDGSGAPAATGALLDNAKYFNNIITLQSLYNYYRPAARPSGGLFDLNVFRNDASGFLTTFINTKIDEITTGGTTTGGSGVVPLPAGAWLMLAGVGAFGAMKRRKDKAAA